MIGFSLVAEGFGFVIPKGYLYAAIGFSILIEVFNQIARARRKHKHQDRPMRERTAHAVLRLLGGRRPASEAMDEEIEDLVGEEPSEALFELDAAMRVKPKFARASGFESSKRLTVRVPMPWIRRPFPEGPRSAFFCSAISALSPSRPSAGMPFMMASWETTGCVSVARPEKT